jgi:hypothetical protein
VREAECGRRMREILAQYPEYYVPKVGSVMCTGKSFWHSTVFFQNTMYSRQEVLCVGDSGTVSRMLCIKVRQCSVWEILAQ